MHPWTTPPTSWPTPLQPANPSSTWPPQSTSMASTPRPPMTWPTTAPPPTSTPQPAFTIEPQQFVINSPHSSGTTPTPVEHLDNLRHYILRGLLRPRPNRQLPLCRHCHSLPLQQPLMQYQLHTLDLLQLHL